MRGGRPRRRSHDEPGHAHELTFSCHRGFRFLSADRTRLWLADAIEGMRASLDVAVWAYVFIPEHVHLIVWPRRPDAKVSAILKAVKEPVARRATSYLTRHAPDWLPKITDRGCRHFWLPGGGYDRNVHEPGTLQAMIDYVHLNPVRRGLVERPADWRWSSAAWYERSERGPLTIDPIPPEWTGLEA
ncbi:MAG: transposase [Isosphaeraceae bacterium]